MEHSAGKGVDPDRSRGWVCQRAWMGPKHAFLCSGCLLLGQVLAAQGGLSLRLVLLLIIGSASDRRSTNLAEPCCYALCLSRDFNEANSTLADAGMQPRSNVLEREACRGRTHPFL